MHDLSHDLSLDDVADDLVFTLFRTATHADTDALAKRVAGLLVQLDAVAAEYRQLRRTITQADAQAWGVHGDIADFIDDLLVAVMAVVAQNREDPRYAFVFHDPPSAVKRFDHKAMWTWLHTCIMALESAVEPPLQALLPRVRTLLAAFDAADRAQYTARSDNRIHDVTRRTPLRDEINGARTTLHADLAILAVDTHRSKAWVETYFRAPHPAHTPAS